ncbi:membrane protein (plasmid) [Aliivibrio wodanis]|uniref:Membrane protein n=1 Tax=Aliivibrio wodanis TaxID=80852 RepID=A0A090K2J5_9GAMM|nr:membrane protein [Aliivibrio wodanis]
MKYILPTVGVALHLFIVGFLIGFNGLFIIKMEALTTLLFYIPLGFLPLWPLIRWYQQRPSPITFMCVFLLKITIISIMALTLFLAIFINAISINHSATDGGLDILLLCIVSVSLFYGYLQTLYFEYINAKYMNGLLWLKLREKFLGDTQ